MGKAGETHGRVHEEERGEWTQEPEVYLGWNVKKPFARSGHTVQINYAGSLDSLAQLVQTETQDLLNVNLSTFESLVFPFPSIKDILDTNTTSMIFNSSGVTEDSYGDSTLTRVLTNAEINLSLQQFAILYNKSDEQAKTIDRTTLNQIYHMCDISVEIRS